MALTSIQSRVWPISNWRIGFKLTLVFLLLTLVPITAIGLIVINLSRNALLAQGTVALQSASQATARQIDSELRDQREFITVVGLLPETVRFVQNQFDPDARDAAQRVLTAAAEKGRDYESVAIVNKQGTIILSSFGADVGTDVRSQVYFVEAFKGATFISDPSISVVTGQPAIFYSAPIKDDSGTILAVVSSRLKIGGIWDFVELDDGSVGSGSFGMLLDEYGIRLAHSSSKGNREVAQDQLLFRSVAPLMTDVEQTLVKEKRLGRATESEVQVLPLPEVAMQMGGAEPTVFETRADTNSARNQAVMVKLANKPWRYVVAAPVATFTSTADRITLFVAVFSFIVGVVAVILALLLSRSITRPIVRLSQIADRISLGELDAKIEVNSNDEIGELSEAFGRMQASLQAAVERLRSRRTGA